MRIVGIGGEDEDTGLRGGSPDGQGDAFAVEPGETSVQEEHVGAQGANEAHRFLAVARLGQHDEVALALAKLPEPGADQWMIVDEHDANGLADLGLRSEEKPDS